MLSQSKKIFIFLLATIVLSGSIFFYELVVKKRRSEQEAAKLGLVEFERTDINFIVIDGGNNRIVLQKNSDNWLLLEPIQDKADQSVLQSILDNIKAQNSKKINTDSSNVSEFKLDKPSATWTIKSSKGQSVKIIVSQENNFEGYPFITIADSQKINLGLQFWKNLTQEPITFFREKSLFRKDIEQLDTIRVQSSHGNFTLKKVSQAWTPEGQTEVKLDQHKVKDFLTKIQRLAVQEYVSDGEPSHLTLKDLGLDKNYVQVNLSSGTDIWSSKFQMDDQTKSLFALTDRPTQLVKLDVLNWELLANLDLDQFRDRSSVFSFSPLDVQKIYVKTQIGEFEIQKKLKWIVTRSTLSNLKTESEISSDLVENYLRDFSKQELSFFLEKSDYGKLTGHNMIILKSENDQLLMQLNWGPQIKKKIHGLDQEFYLARTQQDPMVFGLASEVIEKITDFKFIKKEMNQ